MSADPFTDFRRTGERDFSNTSIGDQYVADLVTVPGDHRKHPRRQPGVDEAGRHCQRRQGRGLRWLEHHGVPGRQRRGDLVERQQRRIVERRDGQHDPARLPHRKPDLVESRARCRVERKSLPIEIGALERGQSYQFTRPARLNAGLPDGLAVFRGDCLRNLLGAVVDQLRRSQQDAHSFMRRRPTPDHRADFGCGYRGAGVVHSGSWHRGHHRTVEWRGDLFYATRQRLPPLAADQHRHYDRHCFQLNADVTFSSITSWPRRRAGSPRLGRGRRAGSSRRPRARC